MGYDWSGTRAGQAGFVVIVVKEDGGMPYINFDPGDLGPRALGRSLEVCLEMVVAREAAKMALQEKTPDGHMG